MIYIFRKEIKKWHSVLWVVFASLAISGVSLIFWRSPQGADDITIATVNSNTIPLKQFRRSLVNVQQSMQILKEYARMYGMSEDMFLKTFFGHSSPYDLAINNCIKESLLDNVKNSLHIAMDTHYLQEEILKALPKGLIDAQGQINIDSYQRYLQNLATTPAEYEQDQAEDIKRKLIERFVGLSSYTPYFAAFSKTLEDMATKSFTVAALELDEFLKKAKSEKQSEKELLEFYDKNKEKYRIPERKKAAFWKINADALEKNITVSEQTIQAFYDKHKTAMFRNAPQVNVRHLLLEIPALAQEKEKKAIFEKAQKIHQEVKKNPTEFSEYVKKYSDDAHSIKDGGLIGFFKRGTQDKALEHAAFRLQNKGDVSDVIKTGRGYEILQLEERLNATYKPLNEVLEQITKTIRSKKALDDLKSKLSHMHHKAKSDENYIEQFAQENALKQESSNWLSRSMAGEISLENTLAQKLFIANAQASKMGYFFSEGNYVIYKQLDHQPSYIKTFDNVKQQVIDLYVKSKAQDSMQEVAKKIKEDLLHKKLSLEKAAQSHQAKTFQIENATKTTPIKSFKNEQAIKDRLFALSDSSQILQYREGDHIYLVQLVNSKYPDSTKELEAEVTKTMKNEKNQNSQLQPTAFIASLQRNAKIEINEKVLKSIGKTN